MQTTDLPQPTRLQQNVLTQYRGTEHVAVRCKTVFL